MTCNNQLNYQGISVTTRDDNETEEVKLA